jgi:hypothetical protein
MECESQRGVGETKTLKSLRVDIFIFPGLYPNGNSMDVRPASNTTSAHRPNTEQLMKFQVSASD